MEENFLESFPEWVKTFAVETQTNTFTLLPERGNGFFKIFNLEPGLQVRLWKFTVNENVFLQRHPQKSNTPCTFTIIFYLTPQVLLHKKGEHDYQPINKIWNTVFLSSNVALNMQVLRDQEVKICSINVTMEWLTKNLSTDFFSNLTKLITCAERQICIFESSSMGEQKKVSELYNINSQKLLGDFFIHSNALYVINDFFTKLNLRNITNGIINKNYNSVISEVEKRITSNTYKKLPIQALSEEFSMSPSTLKRNFKKMYGKSISEYLKDHKIISKRTTLNETALEPE